MALFGGHMALLFFPPVPPFMKGSLLSYTLAYVAVVLGALELRRHAGTFGTRWHTLGGPARTGLASAAIVGLLAVGVALRFSAPDLFARWSGEEGVWEPITVLGYLTGGLIVLGAARLRATAERRHLALIGSVYLLLTLEEVDYFGIFGGLIGRIDGVYVGSPHDLITLWSHGALAPWMVLAALGTVVTAAFVLWRRQYLQPRRLLRTASSPAVLWVLVAAALIGVAAADDAGLLISSTPSFEELLEAAGALCLLVFGLEIAAAPPPGSRAEPSRERLS